MHFTTRICLALDESFLDAVLTQSESEVRRCTPHPLFGLINISIHIIPIKLYN